jgi:hypothetical protein
LQQQRSLGAATPLKKASMPERLGYGIAAKSINAGAPGLRL